MGKNLYMRKVVRLAISQAPFVAIPSWVGQTRWPIFGIILLRSIDPVKRSQISPTDIGLIVLFGLSRRVSMVAVRNFDVFAGIWLETILFKTANIFNLMSGPHEKICFIREAL